MPPPVTGPLPPGQPRAAMVAEVGRALAGLPEGAAVVVASSGGPDSTACAFLAAEARPDLALGLAHVRHGLRTDDVDDLAVVERHADWLGTTAAVEDVVVAGPGGTEAAARAHRHAALRRMAAAAGAGWVLLGHSADDQAETVLLRIARGTGLTGLGSMAPVRGGLVRPLLRLRRDDLHRFVEGEGLEVVRDPTNLDERIARVAVRRRVLPALAEVGPDPVGALARLAELARSDAGALDRLAAGLAGELLVRFGPAVAVRDEALAGLEPALAARVLRAAVGAARPADEPPTAAQVAALAELPVGAAVDLPELVATRGGGWTALVPRGLVAPVERALAVPGSTPWPPLRLDVEVQVPSLVDPDGQLRLGIGGVPAPPPADAALLPPGAVPDRGVLLAGPLPRGTVLRTRRDGDRVAQPAGTRKLQDVLVDARVPRAVRDLLPVVAVGERVLWVPGVAADDDLRVDVGERPAAVLRVRRSAATRGAAGRRADPGN